MYKSIILLCSIAVTGLAEPERLTLDQALERARQHSPALKAARLQTLAAEKAVDAAGRWKNPKLKVEAEGVGWDNRGFSEGEYTVGLQQTVERGKKRDTERAVALASIGVSFQAEAEQEQALLAEVRRAFIALFSQQEIGAVRAEQEQLGLAFVEVAKRKHAAGGGSELDVVQAELALEEILLSQTCCFGDLQAARVKLASLIGLPEAELGELTGAYYELEVMDNPLISDTHPALRRTRAEIESMRAQAAQARAGDATDFTLEAGYKYEAAGEVNTLVFGAAMPLNFTRKGRALEAAVLMKADAMQFGQDELRRLLGQELSVWASRYSGAKMEADMTRDRLMPKAEQAYQLSKTGYEAGRFSWFELITAQQHLAEIKVRYIEALRDAHLARAEMTRFLKEGI